MNNKKIINVSNYDKPKLQQNVKCMHDKCALCNGTGLKKDLTPCVYYISCQCPKCNPYYL